MIERIEVAAGVAPALRAVDELILTLERRRLHDGDPEAQYLRALASLSRARARLSAVAAGLAPDDDTGELVDRAQIEIDAALARIAAPVRRGARVPPLARVVA